MLLAGLRILSLNLHNPAELVYDVYLYEKINNRNLFVENTHIHLRTTEHPISSSGDVISLQIRQFLGQSFPNIIVRWFAPDVKIPDLGLVLSMRA